MAFQVSQLRQQLALRFDDKSFESKFRRDFARRTLIHNRVGIYLTIAVWLLAGFEVRLVKVGMLDIYWKYASYLLPSFLLTILISHTRRWWKLTQYFAAFANFGAGIMVLYLFARKLDDPFLMGVGFLLVQFFSPFILKIRWGIGTWVVFAYTSIAVLMITHFDVYDGHMEVLVAVALFIGWFVSSMGGYFIERSEREAFVLRDQLKKRNVDLRKDSQIDALTGLNNRRYFFDIFRGEMTSDKAFPHELCLAILDIDHFKKVNDELGHPVGDSVLKEFSTMITDNFRQTDLCARYGGEEFIVLLRYASLENSIGSLNRLLTRMMSHSFEDVPWSLSFSAGVVGINPGDDVDELVKEADELLFVAKRNGRKQVRSPDEYTILRTGR